MSKRRLHRSAIANWSLYQSGDILRVIQTNIDRSKGISAATDEISRGAIALAMRRRPPEAVALAILAAHRRHNTITRN